jgi:hypothetical protein
MIYFISLSFYDSSSDLFYFLPNPGERIRCCRDPSLCATEASSGTGELLPFLNQMAMNVNALAPEDAAISHGEW